MADQVLLHALDLARARHTAICAEGYEDYEMHSAPLAAACEAISAAAEALTAEDIQHLDELIALETQSLRVLERMLGETRTELSGLHRAQRARDAYGVQERLSVNGA